MVQTKKAVEMGSSTLAADPVGQEAKLDLAEELFVSCRFTEAARVCNEALSAASSNVSSARSQSNSSNGSSDQAGSALTVVFEDQTVAPLGECDTSDLIVAVLLQCGFELRRTDEWGRCRAFYGSTRAIPFAVAILWLRLRLAVGEFELVRRVLGELREVLADVIHRATAEAANNSSFETTDGGGQAVAAALSNYSEATEMLVIQILLPCRESTEAVALVANDSYLGPKDKSQLLKACEKSASQVEQEQGEVLGGSAAGNASPFEGISESSSYRGFPRRESPGGPQRDGQHPRFESFGPPGDGSAAQHRLQGPVQKFFSDVSDWTPEARIQLVVGAGAAGLAAYAALRNRESLWRAAYSAAGTLARTAGDLGAFIVGSS